MQRHEFINHIVQRLGRSLGQWQFTAISLENCASVVFFNTQRRYTIELIVDGQWSATEQVSSQNQCEQVDARLTGILNGKTRDDSGVVS